MFCPRIHWRSIAILNLVILLGLCELPGGRAAAASIPWPQWGGPARDFHVQAPRLADQWPADGPRKLWSRPLGQGYSAIVADGKNLYTLYRTGPEESVVALNAADGRTVWEHKYAAKPDASQTGEFGHGPNATPLLLEDRIIAAGFTGVIACLSTADGKVLWSHDLLKEFKGSVAGFGYSSSPLAFGETVICTVGGKEHGAIAFRISDGSIVWKSAPFSRSHASPLLIRVGGQEQLVCRSEEELIGMNPGSGEVLWRARCTGNFAMTPLFGEDGLMFGGAPEGETGSQVLRISMKDGKTVAEPVWNSRKVNLGYWNAIRVGDLICASIGSNGTLLAGVDIHTGSLKWRQRGFRKANSIFADNKLFFIDEGGALVMAKVLPAEMKVLGETKLLEEVSWTVPTIVGTTLYARDKKHIVAVDLGVPSPSPRGQG